MVKAPRSNGCRVCVQRRVKCDQGRPFCRRCQRANRQCPGYETTKFVDEGPSLRAIYKTSGDNDPSFAAPDYPSSSSSTPEIRGSRDDQRKLPRPSRSLSKSLSKTPPDGRHAVLSPVNSDNWRSGAFERAAIICLMCPTAYQDQLLSNFIDSIKQPTPAPTFRCHSIWLREVAAREKPSSALVWATRAISIAHLGRKSKDSQLIETSRSIYGKALLKLNEAIQDPEEGFSSDTLSATVLLSFYEILNCTHLYSWVKHAGGAGQLIRQRGVHRHRHGFDCLVLMSCRYLLIMESFQNRKPCFLNAPEWRQLFWDIHQSMDLSSPLANTNEEFFHNMVLFPEYVTKVFHTISAPEVPEEGISQLMKEGQQHRSKFQNNHARMVDELRSIGKEPTKTASSYNDKTFPVVYDFPDIHIASLYCGYWSMLIALNISLIGLQAKLARLYKSFDPSHFGDLAEIAIFPNGTTHLIPKRTPRPLWDAARALGDQHLYYQENRAYANEICKSTEFMQQTPFVGPLFLVLSLRMAVRMDMPDNEKQWIVRKLNEIGNYMELARAEIEIFVSTRDPKFVERLGQSWESVPLRGGGRKTIVRSDAAVELERRDVTAHATVAAGAASSAEIGSVLGLEFEAGPGMGTSASLGDVAATAAETMNRELSTASSLQWQTSGA